MMSPQGQDHGQQPQHQLSNQHHRVPDLVRDSQLNTRFLPGGATQHTVHVTSKHPSRRRRIRVEETWHRERELGNGTFGRVWLQRCASGPAAGSLRAVKEMQKDPALPVDYTRELEAMAKFSHEKYVHCFVKCHGWYMSENMVFIAMEHLEHGDLQKYLNQPFPEGQAKEIASQLAEGLVYLHDNGFAHRDLKPANILVHRPGPNWWVKIGDFGISKRAEQENTALRTLIGTEGYLAPEIIGFVFNQDSSSSDPFSYTFAVDMWALGELTFRLIAQRPAFPNRQDLFNCVVRGYPFPMPALQAKDASEDCCDFIMKSMIADPEKRLTAHEATAHIWVQTSRPSSRASSTSSRMMSEVLIVSSNPSIQNAHLAGTPSTSQLVSPFEDTAQWSTGIQEPQHQLSTSPFENTAQWSTEFLEPQQAQAAQQRLSTSTYIQSQDADRVNLTPQELPNSQRWSGPPTPSLTPQPTQSPGFPETAQPTLESQVPAIHQLKNSTPGLIQSSSQQFPHVTYSSNSTEAPATEYQPLFHDGRADSRTEVPVNNTQPLSITDAGYSTHSGSIVYAEDNGDKNTEEALPWARPISMPPEYYPYKPRREESYSLSDLARATMRAKAQVEAAQLEVEEVKKREAEAEVKARLLKRQGEKEEHDRWLNRQKMERRKLSRRQSELSKLQSEYEAQKSKYEQRRLQEDKPERDEHYRAAEHKTPPLQSTFEAQQRKHEQWKLAESEGHDIFSTEGEEQQRNRPTETVKFDAFESSRTGIDTPSAAISDSDRKGNSLHSTSGRIGLQTQGSLPESGKHSSMFHTYSPYEIDVNTEHDMSDTYSAYEIDVNTQREMPDAYSVYEMDINTERERFDNGVPNIRELRNTTISTYKPPPARLILSSTPFDGESTEIAGNVRRVRSLSNSSQPPNSPLKSSPPSTMPPARFSPDFTRKSTGPSVISRPPKPTNKEITTGIARLDKLDPTWRSHIGQDLLNKGLDAGVVWQNYEFLADFLEERQQMMPFLETPAPPPSPVAEVVSRFDAKHSREQPQRDRDSGFRGWFKKKFVP